MKTNILLMFILILNVSQIKGQDPDSVFSLHKSNSFNIQFGLNQIKEMNLIPLVHKGMLTELSFETETIKSNLRMFQFFLIFSRVKTSLEEMSKSGNIKLGLNYSYNFLIFHRNNLRYYLGPQTSLSYSFMLFPNFDDSHSYWADYLSFGPNNILSVSLRHQSEWFTSLNFTLFSLFSRPEEIRPFKMDDSSSGGILKALNSNIEPGLINKVFQLRFKTEYRFPVFVIKREAITFNMDIIHISGNDEQPVFQIINRFGIKIML
jgi:hypothetical protein